jgi:menaquinone-9 beta-reductase
MKTKPVRIVGGGLAGLALGIFLRQADVPVALMEAGSYPRHRVCGEFMSGAGLALLGRLGLDRIVRPIGRMAEQAAFFTGQECLFSWKLPQPALSLSRWRLDHELAGEFVRCGGQLFEKQRWASGFSAEGVIRATGRKIQSRSEGWRWIGIKAQGKNVSLCADLEMHFFPQAYIGVNQVENDTFNVCGLFRSAKPLPALSAEWEQLLRGRSSSLLSEKLKNINFDLASLCFVAGLPLNGARSTGEEECAIGDAWGMIPPFTGNGMSLALESAELAAEPLTQYSHGFLSWSDSISMVRLRLRERFRKRLLLAGWLQRALFNPASQQALRLLTRIAPGASSFLFHHTR